MSDGTKKDNRFPRKTRELIRIIKKADEEDRLYETVMEELQHPVSMPALWACREYIDQLRDEVCHQDGMESYLLLSISALIATMEDELEKAEQYLALLGETPAHIDAGQCNGKDYIRMATEIVMPYVSDNKFFHIAAALTDMKLPVKNLTLSASRPSILNGFRDFTRYGRKIAENRTALQKTIQTLYGDKSKGVIDIALAEWYYQENDPFHALLLITGTIPFMENKRDIQCLFVAMALQMKILLLNGQIKAAEPLVAQIKTQIEKWGWEELMNSLKALTAWAACYDGNMDVVQEWMTGSAPDETKPIYMMDVYAYLVKIRCYLFAGKHMLALVLAKRMLHILKKCNRYMDICECHMMIAIACYKADSMEDMCGELEQAILLAKRYRYIRLLADEGAYMEKMLRVYREKKGSDDFTDQILELAMDVAKRLPDYMKSPEEYAVVLTPTEKKVLKLMVDGLSYEQIGEKLNKKVGTVKYHTSGIYRKLGVKNRQQAVKRAAQIEWM